MTTKVATMPVDTKTSKLSYKDMIKSAIAELKERNGSSRHALKKYLQAHYDITSGNFDSLFNMAIRKGVDAGDFVQPKGASGPLKINKVKATAEKKEPAPKKGPAAKKESESPKKAPVAPKKTVTPPKKASVTSKKETGSPKKAVPKKSAAKKEIEAPKKAAPKKTATAGVTKKATPATKKAAPKKVAKK
ncbi:hypothetical protein NADFUDRAFT_48166 [Nadsonia fulvescens var. elongata DSM 6958]|uniref:Histone H1 n=1 Tax=Nadsonia fulvescens var. elongata DSM 6958 TaxID=857566 RepID=A0A1E3PD31_9ASCO|nr:hypothetical protein NADFUDRAFT_48166 [Nadsonia fulvescens var. elongata DSM 6958]